jgi:acetyl/propionyl-CoA carboxylase alpha subunit
MIAKLICTAIERRSDYQMKRALQEFVIEGIKTTIPFHIALMDNAIFRSGKFTTKFLETVIRFQRTSEIKIDRCKSDHSYKLLAKDIFLGILFCFFGYFRNQ